MLPGRTSHDVLSVTGKATFLPQRPAKWKKENRQYIVNYNENSKENENPADAHLLTRSCNFWIGSGSPSFPHARTSPLSYTRMIRSAEFTRKQLQRKQKIFSLLNKIKSFPNYHRHPHSNYYHYNNLTYCRRWIRLFNFICITCPCS